MILETVGIAFKSSYNETVPTRAFSSTTTADLSSTYLYLYKLTNNCNKMITRKTNVQCL